VLDGSDYYPFNDCSNAGRNQTGNLLIPDYAGRDVGLEWSNQ
jgi:hypothetical protein